jgi:hypothetical protein
MRTLRTSRSPKQNATSLKKHQKDFERIHITLNSDDRKDIEAYRDASTIGTRAEAIRYLSGLALAGTFPKDHLKILSHLAAESRIRDVAHGMWEQDGRPEGEPVEKQRERWFRAKAAVEAEDAAAKRTELAAMVEFTSQ